MRHVTGFLFGLITAGMMTTALADPPVASHADSFSKEGLFKADVSKLKDTKLVPHPDVAFNSNKNVIWCGTLQLAWNKAIDLVGEKLRFANQPPVVDLLNLESFTSADLDPSSYVALADFERNNVEDEIRTALEKTFKSAASPELIPPKPTHPGPDDFVAYSYLYKNLSFPKPFAENNDLVFDDKPVQAFGFKRNDPTLSKDVFEQVTICDYKSPEDFIIKLKTKSRNDQLILAQVTPGSTLQTTINDVLTRIAQSHSEKATKKDVLKIPKLNFDLKEDFTDLEGLVLQPSAKTHVKNLITSKVEQLVRFQLNEKGSVLKSEAVIAMVGAAPAPSVPQYHSMVFYKPFLILLKQANSDKPYFAMWVGNASLLVPAGK